MGSSRARVHSKKGDTKMSQSKSVCGIKLLRIPLAAVAKMSNRAGVLASKRISGQVGSKFVKWLSQYHTADKSQSTIKADKGLP